MIKPAVYRYFGSTHGRPNIRYEFALKLQRKQKPSNASSLDSSNSYENLAQMETFFFYWNPGGDWLPLRVVRWPISNALLNDIWLTRFTRMCRAKTHKCKQGGHWLKKWAEGLQYIFEEKLSCDWTIMNEVKVGYIYLRKNYSLQNSEYN